MQFSGGVYNPTQKYQNTPNNSSQTPPEGGPNTGQPGERRRPFGLRDLQGDEHQPRHAQALAGPAAPAGSARRGQDAGAGEDDRAHGPGRGRAGRADPHSLDGPRKNAELWGGEAARRRGRRGADAGVREDADGGCLGLGGPRRTASAQGVREDGLPDSGREPQRHAV